MISEKQFKDSAKALNVEVATIKAVAEIEGGNSGFLATGEPVILFEPHIFWKQLKSKGIDPNKHVKGNEDILYPIWGTTPYGKSSQQHERLARASKINRDAALKSASWGVFQIMGFNFKLAGYNTLQAFINDMYLNSDKHLEAFVTYVANTFLDDELRAKDFKSFARQYNGSAYYKNQYDIKLKKAYEKYRRLHTTSHIAL